MIIFGWIPTFSTNYVRQFESTKFEVMIISDVIIIS